MGAPQSPAGWYPDPAGTGQRRYFDGAQWGPLAPPPELPVAQFIPPPPPGPKRKAKVWPWLVAVVLVIWIIGSAGGNDDDEPASATSTTSSTSPLAELTPTSQAAPAPATAAPAPEPLARMGAEVRDGKFAFVVVGMDRSQVAGDLSNEFMQAEAQGEFINVTIQVTNTGEQAQTFFATNQYLMADGKEFEADSTAAFWSGASNVEINPGNSITAVASFDVPPGTQPDSIDLHDSLFSGGVEVSLV